MRPTYIYALINPINDTLFYIGATKNLKKRLSGHNTWRYILKDPKSKILREIIECGKTAEILTLDTCFGDDLEVRRLEEFYIGLFKSYGFPLHQYSISHYCSNRAKPARFYDSVLP